MLDKNPHPIFTPGTVMTALRMEWPRYASAVSFILVRVKAPIWLGEYLQEEKEGRMPGSAPDSYFMQPPSPPKQPTAHLCPPASTQASPLSARMIL